MHLKKTCKIWCVFQNQLNKDVNMINKDPLFFIAADKYNNLYKFSKDTYSKLLQDNVKSYKTSKVTTINNINKDEETIAAKPKVDDRVDQLNQSEAFFTLKDRKVKFEDNLKRRFINPAQLEIRNNLQTLS